MSTNGLKDTAVALALSAAVGLSSGPATAGDVKSQIDMAHAETRADVMTLLQECDANSDGAITGRENGCKIKRGIRLEKAEITEIEQQTEGYKQQTEGYKQQTEGYKQQNNVLRQEIEGIKQEIRLKISKK